MTDALHTEAFNGHQIAIYYDDDPQSPRQWDNLGTMVCWHSRYRLGDEQPKQDPTAWLESQLDFDDEQTERLWAKIRDRYDQPMSDRHLRLAFREYDEALLERFAKQHIILPLYLYDHSGITMNTTGFSCPWDSGQVGSIYIALEDVRREYGVKRVSPKLRSKVEDILRSEVSTYDDYLRGNVYGFVIEKNGEEIDSCWGFYGDYEEYCLNEARAALPTPKLTPAFNPQI